MEPHISLAAEKIGNLGALPFTNSILTTWIVALLILTAGGWVAATRKLKPGSLQNFIELVFEGLQALFSSATGEKTKKVFPLLATLFLFIILGNWMGLLPGVGSIGFFESDHGHEKFIPLFRGATADLNTTLALALVAVAALQYYGFKTLGSRYITRFINFGHPISFFVGVLEIVSEFAKVVSFSLRLFGNIFAGEVLLTIVAFLMPIVAPLPFLGLELFIGFIQAFIFAMLTAVFLRIAMTSPEH